MSAARYVAAIDQGTTSTRCMIFDHAGSIICYDQQEHRQIYPQPGWVEHDPREIWAKTQAVVRGALAQAKVAPESIVGIGFDATCSLVVLGEGDVPLTVSPTGVAEQNVIVWMLF